MMTINVLMLIWLVIDTVRYLQQIIYLPHRELMVKNKFIYSSVQKNYKINIDNKPV